MVLKRVALTGASGLLGRHLRASLEAAGATVLASARSAVSGTAAWDLAQWQADDALDALFGAADAVVHAGAAVPRAGARADEAHLFDANVRACVNLGQWARARGKPLVHISGGIVYAEPASAGLTEDAALGWSGLGGFYGLTKLLAEQALDALRAQGLRLAVVRASSLYGWGLPADKMLSRFLATAAAGGAIELAPPVHDRVDLVHAGDVAQAVLAILARDAWETFNVASGTPVSIEALAAACVAAAGRGRVAIAADAVPTTAPVTRFALDCSRAAARLGWHAQTSLARGLELTLGQRTH